MLRIDDFKPIFLKSNGSVLTSKAEVIKTGGNEREEMMKNN